MEAIDVIKDILSEEKDVQDKINSRKFELRAHRKADGIEVAWLHFNMDVKYEDGSDVERQHIGRWLMLIAQDFWGAIYDTKDYIYTAYWHVSKDEIHVLGSTAWQEWKEAQNDQEE